MFVETLAGEALSRERGQGDRVNPIPVTVQVLTDVRPKGRRIFDGFGNPLGTNSGLSLMIFFVIRPKK